jgi:uncharacterized protein (DUF111 family)
LGVFTLTLVANALTGIPVLNCVGWLMPFLLGVAGLGAVFMTRFGTQPVMAPVKAELAHTVPLASVVPVTTEPVFPTGEPAVPARKPRLKKGS